VFVQPEVTVSWWRNSGGRLGLQRVALQRGSALATTAQDPAACFDLLSHRVEDGCVLVGCVLCLFRVCLCVVFASACYVTLLPLLI
jgi:hypothetical protein